MWDQAGKMSILPSFAWLLAENPHWSPSRAERQVGPGMAAWRRVTPGPWLLAGSGGKLGNRGQAGRQRVRPSTSCRRHTRRAAPHCRCEKLARGVPDTHPAARASLSLARRTSRSLASSESEHQSRRGGTGWMINGGREPPEPQGRRRARPVLLLSSAPRTVGNAWRPFIIIRGIDPPTAPVLQPQVRTGVVRVLCPWQCPGRPPCPLLTCMTSSAPYKSKLRAETAAGAGAVPHGCAWSLGFFSTTCAGAGAGSLPAAMLARARWTFPCLVPQVRAANGRKQTE